MKIELKDICKNFGDKTVLNKISFSAESGKALGLLGRNGAGKTTSIRILMGVFYADSGEVLLDGEPIDRDKLVIGYLPEERGMYAKKEILEQLVYFAELKGMKKSDARESSMQFLRKLGMEEYAKKKLETLSKGNQQKIQLIATLVSDPDIIILDEPFSGLDPVNAQMLKNLIKEEQDKGKVVIFSSHQMNYIEEFCENIAIIKDGSIVLAGNLSDIKRSYERNKIILECSDIEKVKNSIKHKYEPIKDGLLIHIEKESQKGDLIKQLAAMEIDINTIKIYEPDLNSIFIEYTEGKNEAV